MLNVEENLNIEIFNFLKVWKIFLLAFTPLDLFINECLNPLKIKSILQNKALAAINKKIFIIYYCIIEK